MAAIVLRPLRARSARVAVAVVATAGLTLTPTLTSADEPVNPVVFDAGPGRNHPAPATLGPYTMTAYPDDPKKNTETSVIPAPGGDQLTISNAMTVYTGNMLTGGWAGTTGEDIYLDEFGDHQNVTLTLPPGVDAISFYATTTMCSSYQAITVTTDNGTSSGLQSVSQACGVSNQPRYFGFYTTDGSAISSVTLNDSQGDGLIFGELMQHRVPPAPVVHDRSLTLGFTHPKREEGRLDLSGDLSVTENVNDCIAAQSVIIKRYNSRTSRWTRLGSTLTTSEGRFRYRTIDKKSRYMAVVRPHSLPQYDVTDTCSAATVTGRHVH